MSQVVASITLGPDPGSRTIIASYHGWFPMQATTQEMNVSLKQNGSPVLTKRYNPGDPGNFWVDLTAPIGIGPQGGNVTYTAEIDWGNGSNGQAATFADPAYNRLAITVWPAGGT